MRLKYTIIYDHQVLENIPDLVTLVPPNKTITTIHMPQNISLNHPYHLHKKTTLLQIHIHSVGFTSHMIKYIHFTSVSAKHIGKIQSFIHIPSSVQHPGHYLPKPSRQFPRPHSKVSLKLTINYPL